MKYLLTIFAVVSAIATLCIFILFIWTFIMWLGGGFNIILPGLGLVINGSLILFVLLIVGLILLVLTALLARKIFKPLR